MAAKRRKLDPVVEACRAIAAIPVTRHLFRNTSLEAIDEGTRQFLEGLGPGPTLIGSVEEESHYDREATTVEDDYDDDENDSSSEEEDDASDNSEDQSNSEEEDYDDSVDEDDDMSTTNGDYSVDMDGEDIEEGDIDIDNETTPKLPSDYVHLPDGSSFPNRHYFGDEWVDMIKQLRQIRPLVPLLNMPTVPHDYQLKGAAQLDWLCRGVFRGGLLGDPMGLGKTLTAILALRMCRDEPGISVVVCPKSLCAQWVEAIQCAFTDEDRMTAVNMGDRKLSTNELIAGGWDVAVASYDAVEYCYRSQRKLADDCRQYVTARREGVLGAVMPQRPECPLTSELWSRVGLEFKRLVLDEVQVISKRGARYRAMQAIPAQATIMLSGSLAHNRWQDLFGYLAFIQGHPFETHSQFIRQFTQPGSGMNDPPPQERLFLLQRFLMAFTIIRPKDLLKLPECKRITLRLSLPPMVAQEVARYLNPTSAGKREADNESKTPGLEGAVRAQLRALHPLLVPPERNPDPRAQPNRVGGPTAYAGFADELNNTAVSDSDTRVYWLRGLYEHEDLRIDSVVLQTLTDLLVKVLRDRTRKVVVFSQYLKFLDMISVVMEKEHEIEALRYNGSVSAVDRERVQQRFASTDDYRLMLMTIGAGGVGLNLTAANAIVIAENGWNKNVELQAIARAYRQGQKREVLVYKFNLTNSAIDRHIVKVRNIKTSTNEELIRPLIFRHDEEPSIPPMLF